MATIVNLESSTDGIYKVTIKREYDSSTQTREFTKEGLKEYLRGLEEYCQYKGYEFVFSR